MEEKIYDIAVVGCGPAGLSAAINAKRRNTELLILGSDFCSPKLYKAAEVDNYLGFHNINGEELRQKFLEHVQANDIPLVKNKIDNIYSQGEYYTLISSNESYNAYTVVLATGVSNSKYLKGEEMMVGRGVSYCGTCDGPLFKGKDVAVVAYTEEGVHEAEYLSGVAANVYFIPQFDYDNDGLLDVEVINDKPVAVKGEELVEGLELKNKTIEVDGIFIFREVTPPDKLIPGLELNKSRIKVSHDMETNLPGVYAAGDCTGIPYQISKAVGQGQIAGLNAAAFARKKRKELVTV